MEVVAPKRLLVAAGAAVVAFPPKSMLEVVGVVPPNSEAARKLHNTVSERGITFSNSRLRTQVLVPGVVGGNNDEVPVGGREAEKALDVEAPKGLPPIVGIEEPNIELPNALAAGAAVAFFLPRV